jgi:hypothetical protein
MKTILKVARKIKKGWDGRERTRNSNREGG